MSTVLEEVARKYLQSAPVEGADTRVNYASQ